LYNGLARIDQTDAVIFRIGLVDSFNDDCLA